MLVANLFGAPGAGKSTTAAMVFALLKQNGVNAELSTEFAKDKVWEQSPKIFQCQEYIFGKQSWKLKRLENEVDVVVTDSPLLNSIIYNSNPVLGEDFNNVVVSCHNYYNNINFLLKRNKPYNPKGRFQTEEESDEIYNDIFYMLTHYIDSDFVTVNGDQIGAGKISYLIMENL